MKIHNSIKILVDIGVWDDLVEAIRIIHPKTQREIRCMINSNMRADEIITGFLCWRETSQGYEFWNEKYIIARKKH